MMSWFLLMVRTRLAMQCVLCSRHRIVLVMLLVALVCPNVACLSRVRRLVGGPLVLGYTIVFGEMLPMWTLGLSLCVSVPITTVPVVPVTEQIGRCVSGWLVQMLIRPMTVLRVLCRRGVVVRVRKQGVPVPSVKRLP